MTNEQMFKQISDTYTGAYAQSLRDELNAIEQSGPVITPRLDSMVKRGISAGKRRRNTHIIMAIAACLALALIIPQALDFDFSSQSSASSAAPAAPVADAPAAPSPQYELIPLSFTLPEGFRLSGVEQDNAQSIYYINDYAQDNAVLTLENGAELLTEGLTAIQINGHTVYAFSGDYQLITFKLDDMLYTLTCSYDINTIRDITVAALLEA